MNDPTALWMRTEAHRIIRHAILLGVAIAAVIILGSPR